MSIPQQMNISKGKLLRILGSLLLIALVVRSVNVEESAKIMKQIDLWIYAITFIIFMGNKLLSTYRWKLLLQVQDIEVGLFALYKVNLFGMVFNNILPSTLGGDSVRMYWLIKEYPPKKAAAIIATATDRFLGLIALIFLVFISLPFNSLIDDQIQAIGMGILGLVLVIIGMIVWSPKNWVSAFVRKFMFTQWLQDKYDQSLTVFKIYKKSKVVILSTLLLAVLFQILAVLNAFLRFKAISVDVPIQHLLLVIPITTLIVTIPISIGGFGLREISLIGLLGVVGMKSFEVVSFTLVNYSSMLLLSILLIIYNNFDQTFQNIWPGTLPSDQNKYEASIEPQ